MAQEDAKHPVVRKSPVDSAEHPMLEEGLWFMPAVDVYESDEAFIVVADMPGVAQGATEISLREDDLMLTGYVSYPFGNETPISEEFEFGHYHRHFDLRGIDAEKVTASLKDGILKVTLPKRPEYKSVKIEIE